MPRPAPADPPYDWTTGPAKWAAVAVLGASSIAGMAWSITTRAPRHDAERALQTPAFPHPLPPATALPLSPAADSRPPNVGPPATDPPPLPKRINLNTATEAELQLLPGIGPGLAARIAEDRRTLGPFKSVDDLDRVRGIGARTIEKLRRLAAVE